MSSANHRDRLLVLALVLVSLLARLAMLKGNLWQLGEDVDDYLRLATNLCQWGTYGTYDMPSAFRPPLYPLVLAPIYWLDVRFGLPWIWRETAIAILHLIFGAVATVLTFRVAQRWGLAQWSLLAGALVALDPILLHYVRQPMTETLAAMLVAAAIYAMAVSERRADSWVSYAAGVVLGLGMLCRTTVWAFMLIATVVGGVQRDRDRRRNWEWAAVVLLGALVVQLPWCLRNWIAFGRPILTTTHGGYTLLLGNNESYYYQVLRVSPLGAWSSDGLGRWQDELNMRSALAGAKNEFDRDAYNYRTARATIAAWPGDFALAVAVRLLSLWRVTPHDVPDYSSTIRLGCAVFYIFEFALMVWGLIDRRAWRWPLVLLPAALISFSLVHAVYWSDMRMRAPIVPAIALLAALGAAKAWNTLRTNRSETISGPAPATEVGQPAA
jgi:4-amino-4-deoxy-L-arabinose transferase-like glycosyltransferase